MKAILETKKLVKYYGTDENLVKAIDHTDIRIEPGEFVAGDGRTSLTTLPQLTKKEDGGAEG